MGNRKTITVSITPEQDASVRDRLKTGRFSSVSEIVRAGLRLLKRDGIAPEAVPSPRRTSKRAYAITGRSSARA